MNDLRTYTIGLRRELHMHPELSGQETWTSGRIQQELDALGIPHETAGDKNIIGCITNGTGKRIAIRADFDALPIEEQTELPWKSQIPGIMHACGHDAHTAWLLGTARLLKENLSDWNGMVYLCFQQGEETGLGAKDVLDYLKARGGVDYAIGAHVMPMFDSGIIDLAPGVRLTGSIIFDVDITGRGGHGARPDTAVSAAEIACDMYQQLIRIPANHHEAARTCVVSPCIVQAGSIFNVIPEKGRVSGTIRFLGREDGSILMDKVKNVCEHVAVFHGGSANVHFDPVAPHPVYNDPGAVQIGQACIERLGLTLGINEPVSASDNFGDYLMEYPGFYAMIGTRSSRPGTSCVNHNARFDIDEEMIPKTAQFLFECVRAM